jgi:hypothetical protein
VVDGVLDRPVTPDPLRQQGGVSLPVGQRSDRMDDLGRPGAGRGPAAEANAFDRPRGMREEVGGGMLVQADDLDRPALDQAVPTLAAGDPGPRPTAALPAPGTGPAGALDGEAMVPPEPAARPRAPAS